ncbi:hypothetical protein [Candidatus Arsenophonus triatominarum]|uniref:hypothetical protein n=1 Tax=Candidatus Arsenophonus triatominarum TaxID=57911 RepID=UPI00164F955F|nr:hypothetical protein [Candidatus Arsenophonus triatominarum]
MPKKEAPELKNNGALLRIVMSFVFYEESLVFKENGKRPISLFFFQFQRGHYSKKSPILPVKYP